MVTSMSDYGWEMIAWGAPHAKIVMLMAWVLNANMSITLN